MIGWSFAAGLAFVAIVWAIFAALRAWKMGLAAFSPIDLWEGKDGRFSISKVQLFLWLIVLAWAFASISVARWISTDKIGAAVDDVPGAVLGILGFSVGTTVLSKGITSSYAASGEIKKTDATPDERGPQNMVEDDSGVPDLYKLQLLIFTLLALAVYIPTVFDAVLKADDTSLSSLTQTLGRNATEDDKAKLFKLPDIDQALLFLMGISSSAYIGKKLVTRDKPAISLALPGTVSPGTALRIMGSNFTNQSPDQASSPPQGQGLGAQDLPDGADVSLGPWRSGTADTSADSRLLIQKWTDSEILVVIPATITENQKKAQSLRVIVAGAATDPVNVEVT